MEEKRVKLSSGSGPARVTYSKITDALEMPNLIEVQKNSYEWFLSDGLGEVFSDISPIVDYSGNLILEFVDFRLNKEPKYTIEECKERDATYAAPLYVKCRLRNKEVDEIKEQEIFMGDFPLMTNNGTFIINGAERVIVSQLMRSPGIYYSVDRDKAGKFLVSSQIIPNRGAWLEYETDSNDVVSVRVDRTRKVPVTVLIRSLGVGNDSDIIGLFGEDPKIIATIEKDISKTYEEGLIEMYKRIRPGEPPTVESSESLLRSMFFDPKRYDLAKVGRYKFNKKLSFKNRVKGMILAENAVDPSSGEILAEENQIIGAELADRLQDSGLSAIYVKYENRVIKVLSNMMVGINSFIEPFGLSAAQLNIKERVYLPVLEKLIESAESSGSSDQRELERAIKLNIGKLIPKYITKEDIMASINYAMQVEYGIGTKDDIDHLGNRRIRAVGELLQNQFRIGLTRMERVVKERMTVQDMDIVTPQVLINIRPVTAALKEFFGSSQLSQFMGQTNPLDELSHKRRLSALGPGGLSRDRAGFEVRDVHSSHYGRMCPIETPEGPNIGLINQLATYARINEYGFIEAPYRKLDKTGAEPRVTDEFVYFTADEEENFMVAQANEPLTPEKQFLNKKVSSRYREDIMEVDPQRIDLMDVSPKQIVSVATALIPFLENDDVTRSLMGSNMQRQAVPLLTTDSPIIGTGMEFKAARDSGVVVTAKVGGEVERVTANEIIIRNENGIKDRYKLAKFMRSNQGTCINQRPVVIKGQKVKTDEVIADGPSTNMGELALGKNPLVGFMIWEGYNYEDAILLSETLVQEDVYTSVHIEEYEADARDTKLGPEEITRDIPNSNDETLKDLDENGIIRIGAEVLPNDILVGKVTPKGETELTPEERLLRAIFGEKAREVRDTSLKVPHGESGIIVDVKVFTRENGDEMAPGINQTVRVYIAQKRKISVGDKMAGRHGNKGVISRVLPVEDMPFLPNGRPLDIVLNPLGVPGRMNIGQVLEIHLGLAAKVLGWKVATPVFDGANEMDIMDTLELANDYANYSTWQQFADKWQDTLGSAIFDKLEENRNTRQEWKGVPIERDGKIKLRDGRTGEYFDNPVTVGYMHYLKLHHLVDDKIHARSTGPYSLVTQQPLGGKAQFGGQRFGEMEVWALEAYGASYTLQEILTVKSDDIVGRVKTYEAIVKGENIPEPGVPESFKVLLKELHALSLDVRVLKADSTEVELKESIDDIENSDINIEGRERDDERSFIRKDVSSYETREVEIPSKNTLKFDIADAEEELDDEAEIETDDEEEDETGVSVEDETDAYIITNDAGKNDPESNAEIENNDAPAKSKRKKAGRKKAEEDFVFEGSFEKLASNKDSSTLFMSDDTEGNESDDDESDAYDYEDTEDDESEEY
ncbi:MAG: DNA-directed RNA polymerase subunit beta [Defluviitaleaceae bacterium]|nr:DNA-directed RNA polymerase subunit beta [Defluviitaleaceae bacterium]